MSGHTILVVEDSADIVNYLDGANGPGSSELQILRTPAALLDAIENGAGSPQCVLLDLAVAGPEPLALLERIRTLDRHMPVIVVSDSSSPASIVDAMRSGASDFLTKPLTHDQLRRAIRRAREAGVDSSTGAPRPARAESLIPCNPRMQAIYSALRQVALSDVPVVLRGESGVGKEVLAREIHAQSARASHPFVKINCAALPSELLESELFGYERGAFTGAIKNTPGKFESAHGGTILLDEIGDMDFKLQAKLLHVLQDGEFQRLGARYTVRVNVRVMAATHCDLERAIAEHRFREDLYYRLNVLSIHVPPLRERRDEILPLARFFLDKHALPGAPPQAISAELERALEAHPWPGNIRELENVIRKLLVFRDADSAARELRQRTSLLSGGSPGESGGGERRHHSSLERFYNERNQEETEAIVAALNQTHWNRRRAAELLRIDYKGLIYKMKKLSIGPYQAGGAVRNRRAGRQASARLHQGGD